MQFIMRHGLTEYKQNFPVSLEQADDLTPQGCEGVTQSGHGLYQYVGGKPNLVIHSSPYGRTLHTSKILRNVFEGYGIDTQIIPVYELGEVQNLDYELLMRFCHGGEYILDSLEEVSFDKKQTNPLNVPIVRYFREDKMHDFMQRERDEFPLELFQQVRRTESYQSIRARLEGHFLENKNVDIFVTHEGGTGDLVEMLSGDRYALLDRAGFLGCNHMGFYIEPIMASSLIYDRP